MQKLTTRQALAAIVAIVEAWEPDGLARSDDAFTVRSILGDLTDHGLTTSRGALTDAGRALLADAPRTAEQERADVVAFLDSERSDWLAHGNPGESTALAEAMTAISEGDHIGATEARDGR